MRTEDVIDVVLGRMRGGVVVGGAAVVAVELLQDRRGKKTDLFVRNVLYITTQ